MGGQKAVVKYLMAARNHHHAALDIVDEETPFDGWQE